VKLNPKDQDSGRIVKLMDELFAVDAAARADNMSHAQRHALRLEKAPVLLAAIRAQILAIQKNVLPKSAAGNLICDNYATHKHQKHSAACLQHGYRRTVRHRSLAGLVPSFWGLDFIP
jgi:hypothetical protein